MASLTTIPSGSRFGRYEIQRLLGSGGMGEVYLATDVALGRPVALKVLPDSLRGDETRRLRFMSEARSASSLNHPNIVTVYEVANEGPLEFIATEYIEGVTLRQRLVSRAMTIREILDVISQVAAALAAAESIGLVHRDIKPDNIMIRPDGYVKVLDFGLAKLLDPERGTSLVLTEPNVVHGTVFYMSPEQVRGQQVDSRSDVWSLGVVLYELITGHLPFDGGSAGDVMAAILRSDPPPMQTRSGEPLPTTLDRLVILALQKDKTMRLSSAAEFLREVQELQRGPRVTDPFAPLESSQTERLTPVSAYDLAVFKSNTLSKTVSLPSQLTTFVGRETESQAIGELLQAGTRLLTLTGPGGTGKTRLALNVAASVTDRYDLVVFVPLSELMESKLVPSTIAAALGISETGPLPLIEAIRKHLRSRRSLLIIDNFEQVIEASPVLGDLLTACPELQMIVTSRARLRLSMEQEFAVQPLDLPSIEGTVTPEALSANAAVSLFVQRASASRPGFKLTPDNALVIAEICVRLEGLPLAIELAASRAKLLPPETLLARLEHRLDALGSGPQDLPARQRTMRGAISWGVNLLDEQERTLFYRLSVFRGGFALEAAEAICGDTTFDVFETIASLVDKSMLRQETTPGDARFSMLGTIHDYAGECLEQKGERATIRMLHAEYFRDMAERAEAALHEGRQEWLDRLDADLENLREALDRLFDLDVEAAMRMTAALTWFWYLRGYYTEGRAWFGRALQGSAAMQTLDRAKTLAGAAQLSFLQCEYDDATQMLDEAVTLARTHGDDRLLSRCVQIMGSIAREQGRYSEALDLHRWSETLAREVGDANGAARARNYIAFASWLSGDYGTAAAVAHQTLGYFRSNGDAEGSVWSLINLSASSYGEGDIERAMKLAKEALGESRATSFQEGVAWALNLIGAISRKRGDSIRGGEFLKIGIDLHWRLGDRWRTSSMLECLAGVACDVGQLEMAAHLLGAAAALRDRIGTPIPPAERADYDAALATVRQSLGEEFFQMLWAEGAASRTDAMIEYAKTVGSADEA